MSVRRITYLRQEARLTKFRLGALANVHPSRLSQVENGHVVPYPVELERLARALGWQGEPAALLDQVESGEPDGRR
jgi:transcriptional regulator with XRE-family HTH domain